MKKYWFKNKKYGYGWTPASREGWMTMGVFAVWIIAVLVLVPTPADSDSIELFIPQLLYPISFGVLVLVVVMYKTGETLRWGFGRPKPILMQLHQDPFLKIQTGEKRIEIRLLDKKRSALRKYDRIMFVSKQDPNVKFIKEIQSVASFKTFDELFAVYPNERTDMYQYYTKEEEGEFGVVAIELM